MFGSYLRKCRERLKKAKGRPFGLRQVAGRAGIRPAYLSKIENEKVPPPPEEIIYNLARELELDPNEVMAKADKIPMVVRSAFKNHPTLVAELAEVIGRYDKSTPLTLGTLLEGYKNTDGDFPDAAKLSQVRLEVKQTPASWGKEEARRLLQKNGYEVEDNQGSPNSNSLTVSGDGTSFTVWPKTSWKVRQIRLGTRQSLERKWRDDFFFGFVPEEGLTDVSEGYQLFIVRGDVAKEDGALIDEAWLAKPKKDGTRRKSMGPIIKDVDREPHREIWDKWTGRFKDGWEWLP